MARDDGIVIHVVEHIDAKSVDAGFEGVKASFEMLRAAMAEGCESLLAEFSGVGGFGGIERRLDRHEELLSEILREVRALKPK
jgi:hypothetical protein